MITIGCAVIVIEDGKILLTKREDLEVWCIPGGAMDSGESLVEAAKREVFEETGLKVGLIKLVGIYSRGLRRNHSNHIYIFTGSLNGGKLNPDPSEVIDIGFFDPSNLPKPMLRGHDKWIKVGLSGVGGSLIVADQMTPAFPENFSRADIYRTIEQSGLSKRDYYYKVFESNISDDFDILLGDG